MRHTRSFSSRRLLGCQQLEPRAMLDASALRITEFLASNDNSLSDFEGDSPDWVELYNPSAEAVSLAGLYLTDKQDEPTKWDFPVGSEITAGGYLVVFASSKDLVAPNGELHTNFALSAGGEFLGLYGSDGVTLIDSFAPEYPPQTEDISYGLGMELTGAATTLVATGATARAWRPTSSVYDTDWREPDFNDSVFNLQGPTGIGYENSPGGQYDYTSLIGTTAPTGLSSLYVRIPFDLPSLSGVDKLTLRMKYDDGFVAYLNGVEIAEANAPEGVQWNANASANHDDFEAVDYVSFDVSAAISSLVPGENVLAIHGLNVSNSSSDFLIVPELIAESAVIGSPENLGFFDTPTPGYGNGASFAGFAAEAKFDVPHGFYSEPQSVSIASATPDATIVYTTDGSTPTVDEALNPSNGTYYTGAIPISETTTIRALVVKQDYRPAFVVSSSYLFLDDVVTQSPFGQTPAGWAPNGTNGQELNYGIDPDIINQYGEQAVKDALTSIPSIMLTTDLENLFDASTGIYVNAGNRGRNWERPASAELLYPDGSEGFSVNAGLRIRGGYSRGDFNPKHAFRLYFRGEYGEGKLHYPLFGAEGADEFDVIDLRTAQNYSWSSEGNSQNTFLREVFARDTQADLGQPYTRSQYVHLYLDGQYWGIFMTQERIQEFYGESYLGGDETDYDVVKADLAVSGGTEIADGNDIAWRQLFDLAQQLADSSQYDDNYWTMQGMNPDGTRNESLPVLLDTANLVDYMLIIFYTGGYDSALSQFLGNDRANNWFGVYNREAADEGFQFFLHDNEHSLGAAGSTHGSLGIDRTGPFLSNNDRIFEQFNPQFLHQDLLSHPEYKQLFVDRVQEVMFNDGPLTANQSIARLLERKAQVDPAIIAEAARWGDSKLSTPRNKNDWDNEVNWLVNTYFPLRGNLVLNQLRGDGLFTAFAAPVLSQHGGEIPYGHEISINAGPGTIYYTLDGQTDPRQIGGGINSSAAVQVYTGPITISSNVTVSARLRTASGEWSGLVKATFQTPNMPGDYDANGVVDQADKELWNVTYGSTSDLRADGNLNGRVDASDYALWRERFDAAQSAVALAAVYEGGATAQASEQVNDNMPLASESVSSADDDTTDEVGPWWGLLPIEAPAGRQTPEFGPLPAVSRPREVSEHAALALTIDSALLLAEDFGETKIPSFDMASHSRSKLDQHSDAFDYALATFLRRCPKWWP